MTGEMSEDAVELANDKVGECRAKLVLEQDFEREYMAQKEELRRSRVDCDTWLQDKWLRIFVRIVALRYAPTLRPDIR